MPRMSEAEKQRSHNRILDAAAMLFRENGIEGTSVADVMTAAGMTHGGFYRHFASKEQLVSAAFRHAVDGVVADIESETTPSGRAQAIETYVQSYLSEAHVRERGKGCPLAALGPEIARVGGSSMHEGADAVSRMTDLLQQPDVSDKSLGLASMAMLMGTITLARIAGSQKATEHALEAGRVGLTKLRENWAKN